MMKTEKDVWGNPIMNVQLFVPQDCVAACSRITNIYLDLNKNGEYDNLWGEHVTNALEWPYYQNEEKRKFTEINAYNGHSGNDRYTQRYYVRTYPVVEVRHVGFWTYHAYNATS